MKQVLFVFLFFLLVLVLSRSCTNLRHPRGNLFPRNEKIWEKERSPSPEKRIYPLFELDVPKGHLPPPGECKVWFPGRPLDQQPLAQSCQLAFRQVPLGAWVITHQDGLYKVTVFNQDQENVIDAVRYYEGN